MTRTGRKPKIQSTKSKSGFEYWLWILDFFAQKAQISLVRDDLGFQASR
jgi:hypothetical protein